MSIVRVSQIAVLCGVMSVMPYIASAGTSPEEVRKYERYNKMAEAGVPSAQFKLGFCYANGIGVAKDETHAAFWYQVAAESGNVDGQYYLAKAYMDGKGVSKDEVKAMNWYREAANQGDASSQYSLGYSYQSGRGVPIDKVQAYVYFYLASVSEDHLETEFKVGLRWRDKMERQLSKNDLMLGQKRIFELLRAIAENGNRVAQVNLADCYAAGFGVSKDHAQATFWYGKSADKGHQRAQYELGSSYAIGVGVPWDLKQAVLWYRKSAEQGYSIAQYALGTCYADGQGVNKDEQEAVKWLRRAAINQNLKAQLKLVAYYRDGLAKDDVEAYAFCCLASDSSPEARNIRNSLENEMSKNTSEKAKQRLSALLQEVELAKQEALRRAGEPLER